MSKKKKLDSYDYHEALDRASMINDIMEYHLASLPAIMKHKKLRKDVEKAMDLIGEVYQNVGAIADKKFQYEPIEQEPDIDQIWFESN